MWKHRAYVKALIRQETVQLKHSEQLVLMLIADHCNEATDETSITNSRLGDMTQSAVVTVRQATKTLEKLNIISIQYRAGKAPVYRLPIPSSFNVESDTQLDTGRAHIASLEDRNAAAMSSCLHLMGMSAEQLAMCVFQGIEGMTPQQAKVQAENAFKGSQDPGKVLLEQCKIALNAPSKPVQAVDLSDEEQAERELDIAFELPRSGESNDQFNKRVSLGRARWNAYQETLAKSHHYPLGR